MCFFRYFCLPNQTDIQNDELSLVNFSHGRTRSTAHSPRQRTESQFRTSGRQTDAPRCAGDVLQLGQPDDVDSAQIGDCTGHLFRRPLGDAPHRATARPRFRKTESRSLAAVVRTQHRTGHFHHRSADGHRADARSERHFADRHLLGRHAGHRYGIERHGPELRRRRDDSTDETLPRWRFHLSAGPVGHRPRNQTLLDGHHDRRQPHHLHPQQHDRHGHRRQLFDRSAAACGLDGRYLVRR